MPRAKAVEKVEEETKKVAPKKPRVRAVVKKAPVRKKAVAKKETTVATKKATTTTKRESTANKTKTELRKRVTKKQSPTAEKVENAEEVIPSKKKEQASTKVRKAPTTFADEQVAQKRKRFQYMVVGLLVFVGVGASAAVGLADSEAGQIDVAETIKQRNERMANMVDVDGPVTSVSAPVTEDSPEQGLIGLRPAAPVAPRLQPSSPVATQSATGTFATSSAEQAEEDGITVTASSSVSVGEELQQIDDEATSSTTEEELNTTTATEADL